VAISTREVWEALAELGQLRFGMNGLDGAMQQIVDKTHALFGVDGAGLMLVDSELALRNVAVSDPRLSHLEDLQVRHHEGPCLDAYEHKHLVEAADLAEEQRWPAFVPAAIDAGMRAVLATPLPYNLQAVGVVVVFSTAVRHWTPEGELALIAFTDLAALLIASTMQGEQRSELASQLQRALDSRVVIEQAKGVLVAQEKVAPQEAYEHMRAQARSQRRKLSEVAAEVVASARGGAGG